MPLNFPSSPTDGQVYTDNNTTWIYNATLTKWEKGLRGYPASFLGNIYKTQTILTAGQLGTYNVPTGVTQLVVTVVGGGAGGGGTASTNSSQFAYSGGGGGGSTAIITILSPATSYTYSVGDDAAGGGPGATGGFDGNDSTFTDGGSVDITAGGGGGGGGRTAVTEAGGSPSSGGAGGIATGGDINIPGEAGGNGHETGAQGRGVAGAGGDSTYGTGGRGPTNGSGAGGVGANPGVGPGGGGSGAGSGNSQGSRSGGLGLGGLIIIDEFYAIASSVDNTGNIASKTDMETGTSTILLASAENTKYNIGVSKASYNYDQTTNSISSSTNISSITDNTGGQHSYSFTNLMNDTVWNPEFSSRLAATSVPCNFILEALTTSGSGSATYRITGTLGYADSILNSLTAFGDLA